MFKKIVLTILLFAFTAGFTSPAYADTDEPVYTKLRIVDANTFNEYRYKITDLYFGLRGQFELNESIDTEIAKAIFELTKQGYNYLPDSLSNKNYYNYLITAINKGIKYPNNSSNFTEIANAIENFLEKTNIKAITGRVEAFPKTGNAPLNVTLRGNVADPTGTKIPSYNYTWWMYENGARKVLGDNISLNHIFQEEGNFSIFLDVKSAHKNENGYTDVLPFSSRADIVIKEKVASLIIKVNSLNLKNYNELNFSPDEAMYGLLFDATSSTPTSGAEFISTTWDFGNGVTKDYKGNPKVERIVYATEGEFTVKLTLKTNELKEIHRTFIINVHDPIATIRSSQDHGFLGDKFTFSAQNTTKDKNLNYSWEIIDLNYDEVIYRKSGNLFTYSFKNKGKYNVKMRVTAPSGDTDVDSKIIYINSRAPTADFNFNIPFTYKPNRVFFDATKSYDPDYSDDGKLKYSWIIDGNRVMLEEPNFNGSTGYFTFDSIGSHSVVLEVDDPDGISNQKKAKVSIKSILSVEYFAFPRVAQREQLIRFVSTSPEARFYEWDFGNGVVRGGKDSNIAQKFKESGTYEVKLTVRDTDDNKNSFTKNVYIGNSESPYSFITIKDNNRNDLIFDKTVCDGNGAYIVNRVDSVFLSGNESIDVTGKATGLSYSWKVGHEGYKNTKEFSKKYDELGCFPVKLTVTSDATGKSHSTTSYVQVVNLKPVLSSIDVRVVDETTDPVIVNITALGAKDRDGIIQSYLWYYYTDIDSEPQEFRSTRNPNTTFVLPKVTGNYYFVAVMKDNNEERITSEEITGSKYFITLAGDNLNTPLLKLSVDDSSIAIGDEVTFTSTVENILGQDLSDKVKFSWDFDGDGFYDRETVSNKVTYKYMSSGEKHAKVKAKYKGFSNTKSLTINVSNILKPDFGYISIGNKFVFFDKSLGTAESYEWDLGDGNIVKNKKYFVHEYSDSKTSHTVNLRISEGTKVKNIEAKVVKNVKNRILALKKGLVLFSSPKLNKDGDIILENKEDNAYIYIGESKPDIINYVIDYDVEYDSDLNGGNDDDSDNLDLDSYVTGGVIKVRLNKNKIQTVRVFIKNEDGDTVGSKDVKIIKEYVEETTINLDDIIFDGINDITKFKIEKLKEYVGALPKEHKLQALMLVQKLQEEWGDNREKTNVILELEGFIYEINVDNGEEIINLLESLLVENQEDKSEKAITFNALKNLIPANILCIDQDTGKSEECYNFMISKLEAIKDNENIEENRILGTEILKIIEVDAIMTDKEKTDFKAILKTFIYGGVGNIPEDEKQEVINGNQETNSSSFTNLLGSIIKWFFIIILAFTGIIGLYFIYYLIVNKDKNIGFQDFIIEKTSGVKDTDKKESIDNEVDILSDLEEKDEVKEEVKEKPKKIVEEAKEEVNTLDNIKETKINTKEEEDIPDWLKGNFSGIEEEPKKVVEEEIKEEIKEEVEIKEEIKEEVEKKDEIIIEAEKESEFNEEVEDEKVSKIDKSLEIEEIKEEEKTEIKDEENFFEEEKEEEKEVIIEELSDEKIEEITKIEEEPVEEVKEDNIPDWLKGSFDEEIKTKEKQKKEEEKEVKKEKVEEKPKKEVKEDNIPDWLKGSFDEDVKPKVEQKKEEVKEEKEVKKEKVEEKQTSIKKPFKDKYESSKNDKLDEKDSKDKKVENKSENTEDKPVKKEINKDDKISIKGQIATDADAAGKSTELWDDGMTIPDWLKTDDEK